MKEYWYIPVSINPFQVEYLVPTEDKIEWAVRRIQNNRQRPLGVRANHFQEWLVEARKEEEEAAKVMEGAEAAIGVPGVGRGGGGEGDVDREGDYALGEGGGPGEGVFWGGADGGRSYVTSGGPDPQGERGIPQNRSRGGGVEGSGGNSKLPAHSLHHLPQLPL